MAGKDELKRAVCEANSWVSAITGSNRSGAPRCLSNTVPVNIKTASCAGALRLSAFRHNRHRNPAAVGIDQGARDPEAGSQSIGIDEDFAPGYLQAPRTFLDSY